MANTDDSAAKVAGSQAAGDDGINLSDDNPGAASDGASTADSQEGNDNLTKRMSERINKIRENEVKPLEQRIAEYEQKEKEWSQKDVELRALKEGKTVEEVQEEIDTQKKSRDEILQNDPEVQQLRATVIEHQKAELLGHLRKEFPDDNITSIDDLGDDYKRLVMGGVHPFKAYMAIRDSAQKEQPKDKPLPGSTKSDGQVIDKDFYSEAEIDKLTKEDYLRDPSLMKKAKKSLTRLK